jgi:hypothetical protein
VSLEQRTLRNLRVLVSAGAAVASLLVLPAPAAAAVPCWQRVISDWSDGRIDRTYPTACYAAALRHLPTDVKNYTDASDQIRRALFASIGKDRDATPPTAAPVRQSGSRSAAGPVQTRKPSGVSAQQTDDPVQRAVGVVASKNPSSIPLPLVVVGAVGFLLLAALVARVLQQRSARTLERLRH